MMLFRYAFRLDVDFLTNAGVVMTLGAAAFIFRECRRFQVNFALAGQTRQPGEDVSEFAGEFAPVPMANAARQLADFLSEPAEGAVQTALTVFRQVEVLNQHLKLMDCHVCNYLEPPRQVNSNSRPAHSSHE
jgi:hypothetical protein